jgi:diketogulonate reductase-like aldo/keto reductase
MQRRSFMTAALAAGAWAQGPAAAAAGPVLRRTIPRSGESLPAVGMGTWLTFDVPVGDPAAMARRRQVLERFFAAGGGLVDSSPMYGSAEQVLGELLGELPPARAGGQLFAATKVWTPLEAYGEVQMRRSLQLWRLPRFDLLQVHNLLNWRAHLKTLRAWQERGLVRHIGVTTSHGNKHEEMARVLRSERLDVLQITYNPVDTSAEPLMRLAADRGMAVIVNRPFDGGALLQRLRGRPLPGFAAELGATNWAQLVLKWELAHPAVTCAIPATTQAAHMDENMGALRGPLPDARLRARLSEAFAA